MDRQFHEMLNLIQISLQQANELPRLIDEGLRPDHGLLKLRDGFVDTENLVESTSHGAGESRLNASQTCRQHGATGIKAELSPGRPRRGE